MFALGLFYGDQTSQLIDTGNVNKLFCKGFVDCVKSFT